MKVNIKKYWQLFWHFRKLQVMRMMEYRGDFFFWTFVSIMWTAFNFFFFTLLIGVRSEIAGWSKHELYAFMGVFSMFDTIFWGFFYGNMREYRTTIYDGTFSNLLLKPVNSVYLILTQRNSYNNIPRFFIGLYVLLISLRNLGITPNGEQVLAFLVIFSAACTFVYFTWFLTTTCAFWFDRLENIIEIMPGLKQLYEYPASVYTGLISLIFSLIFPVLMVVTLPTETLLRDPNWLKIGYFVIFSLGIVFLSLGFYKLSIRKYSGIGN